MSNFLRTDIRYIVIQGSWLASGQALNNVLSVVTAIAFANLLQKESFGTYRYILSLFGIFSLAGLTDMGTAVVKSVAEGFEGLHEKVVRVRMRWSLLGTVASLLTSGYYFYKGNDIFGYAFIITALAVPFFEPLNTYQFIFAGKKRFDLQTKYYGISRLLSGLSLVAVLVLTRNVLLILLGYLLPYILSNAYFSRKTLKDLKLNDAYDPSVVPYGKHLSLIAVIGSGISYLEGIIVFQFLGPVQLAVFSIAMAPVGRLQSFFGIIPEIALPKYAERSLEEIKSNIWQKILKGMLLTVPMVAVYMFIVPYFFSIILPAYNDPQTILLARLFALPLIWYPTVMISRILSAKGALKFIYQYNAIGSVMQLGITLVLINLFGLPGAVFAKVFMSAFGNALMIYYFLRL